MDAGHLILALAGAAAGFAASAVPGLHVNALAVLVLALAPSAGEGGVLFLLAASAAAPFGVALSAPFLGAASEDAALTSLPAHALAEEGRGVEAVALAAWGAWTGLALALPLAFLLRGALAPVAPWLPRAMPWLLLAIVLALVLSEPRRLPWRRTWRVVPWVDETTRDLHGVLQRRPLRVGRRRVEDPHGLLDADAEGAHVRIHVERTWDSPSRHVGRLAAAGILLLAGLLGLAAFHLGAESPLGLPASPLLPLLAGLFALPELLRALVRPHRAPRGRLRAPRPPRGEIARTAGPGALASALLGLAPGVSPSHVALALPRTRTPEAALLQVGAIQGGAVVFTLLAWHVLGKARSGALVAAGALAPPAPWQGWAPTPLVLREAALVLAVATLACLLARGLSGPLARVAASGWGPRLALGGLCALLLSVALFNGPLGLGVLAIAGLVGETTRRIGVRRGLAMGVVLVPALLWAWGS